MLQIILTLSIFVVLVIPVGKYLYYIADGKKTFVDKVFDPVDNTIYHICQIDQSEMTWKKYVVSLLTTNMIMALIGYLILRFQASLMLNLNGASAMEPSLSFNTVISFITNTNLQHYAGESQLSYLSQMMVIIFMMFTSAATGFSASMAFIRGLSGKTKGMGNFYVDLIRIITRVLLPASIVVGLLLVSQGVPQNLSGNITVATIEGKLQDIATGPVAALESIKHLGTNGGGFMSGNSTTPIENPTIVSNMIELISMMLLPGGCVIAFGHMIHNRKKKSNNKKSKRIFFGPEARPIFAVMSIIFIIGLSVCFFAESAGNPILQNIGLSQSMGSMEGKEMRFGIAQSSLFTAVTTSFTTGTVNNMHDTLTPLGGAVALMNMMLNVVFGGKGVGLMNMILYAILAVFICSLMIGRTPEYLGKKIDGKEMKLAALGIIIHPLLILGFTALAVAIPAGLGGISNAGHHGLTQVLYEYASSAANNGSGFEGLADNTYFWNITTGIVMFFGRYTSIIIQLAIASSLMMKPRVNQSMGTLKTDTSTFTVSLLIVVLIFAALTFLPALALGPIAEHLILWG